MAPPGVAAAPAPYGGVAPAQYGDMQQAAFGARQGGGGFDIQQIAIRAVSWNLDGITVSEGEKAQLSAVGVNGATAQRYLAWRRSLLWVMLVPLAISGLGLAIDAMINHFKPLNGFGILVEIVRILTLLALPAFAVLGALFWSKPALAQLMTLLGLLVCYCVPLAIGFLPSDWLTAAVELPHGFRGQAAAMPLPPLITFGIMITLLSLTPGILRACLRMRTLLPESPLPGLMACTAAPLSAIVMYSALHESSSLPSMLFTFFALCMVLAPISYIIKPSAFLRPITGPAERNGMFLWQWIYFGLCGLAAVFMIITIIQYVSKLSDVPSEMKAAAKAAGVEVGGPSGFYIIWTAFAVYLDFLGRSLFAAVAFSGLVLRYCVMASRFQQTTDPRISELDPIVGKI